MKKLSLCFTLILSMSFLFGCLDVEQSKFTLKYSNSKGHGMFYQEFTGIKDSDTNSDILNQKKGLEEMLDHIKTVLEKLGSKDVKGQVRFNSKKDAYDAYLSGKFLSLGHLPFFNSINFSLEDADEKIGKISYGRLDQVIEFEISNEDLISTGKKSVFVFESTDKNTTIISAEPEGKINKDKKSVSWEIGKKSKKPVSYRLRLKGIKYKNI